MTTPHACSLEHASRVAAGAAFLFQMPFAELRHTIRDAAASSPRVQYPAVLASSGCVGATPCRDVAGQAPHTHRLDRCNTVPSKAHPIDACHDALSTERSSTTPHTLEGARGTAGGVLAACSMLTVRSTGELPVACSAMLKDNSSLFSAVTSGKSKKQSTIGGELLASHTAPSPCPRRPCR